MRAVAWETSAGALVAFLNATTQAFMADLFTITLSGGTVLRFTSCDMPVVVNGITFAVGPVITRGKTRVSVGIAVDALDVTFAADATTTINGVPLLQFIAAGGLDGARIVLSRAFTSAPGAPWIGYLDLFKGRVSDISVSCYEALLTVASDSELLNTMVPRNVYQSGCNNTLFDGACGLTKAAFSAACTALTTTDVTLTNFNATIVLPTGYFTQGWIVGATGANAGVGRTVKSQIGTAVTTIQPWPQPIATGDTFLAYAGCDKSQATCQSKFSNVIHFRGQPYVPAPETII